MTSTQEPKTMAPQSALCICSRKWKAKLIVPIYFGTKTSEFCLRIISFSLLESENSRPSSLPARVAFHGCSRRLEGKRKVAFHTITDFILLHVLSRNYK